MCKVRNSMNEVDSNIFGSRKRFNKKINTFWYEPRQRHVGKAKPTVPSQKVRGVEQMIRFFAL